MNLNLKSEVINWTPLDLSYKSGGAMLDLGTHALSNNTYWASQTIEKTMTDRGVGFSPEDKKILGNLCEINGLPVKSPTLVIDASKIPHHLNDSPSRDLLPTKPWFTQGGRFLAVATVCVYGAASPGEHLGIYDLMFYYRPNTFNSSLNYLDLKDEKGTWIRNSGYCQDNVMRQSYYIKLALFIRKELLEKDSAWLEKQFILATTQLPQTIHGTASLG